MKITYDMLVQAKACAHELEKFKKMFGDSVETKSLDVSTDASKIFKEFNWGWAGIKLLTGEARKTFIDNMGGGANMVDVDISNLLTTVAKEDSRDDVIRLETCREFLRAANDQP